jgi:ribonuclease HII
VSSYRIGIDENGLGARLGPLVVTGVLARVTGETPTLKVPRRMKVHLDDSKRLVAHGRTSLGEAWARAIVKEAAATPDDLFEHLSLEGSAALKAPCPEASKAQCWNVADESFEADKLLVNKLKKHLSFYASRGVEVLTVKSSVVCTKLLNDRRRTGENRFLVDLHAMERLVLHLRASVDGDVHAICGKVGGIVDYSNYFGPLSDRLHAILEQERAHSGYRFPGVGEVHFIKDADASDPLVMMASLVGKYVRELLMARIGRHYPVKDEDGNVIDPSGYNDPVTDEFVRLTLARRKRQKIPKECFEREGDSS